MAKLHIFISYIHWQYITDDLELPFMLIVIRDSISQPDLVYD